MKRLVIAVTLLGSICVATAASARDYPFCLREGGEAGPGTCYYQSFAQCRAAASGRYADCYSNPRMAYGYQGRRSYDPSGNSAFDPSYDRGTRWR